MASTPPLILRVLASSVSITSKASQIIKGISEKGELGIVEKGVNDLQTEADRSAQRSIIHSLLKKFPGISVVGEEDLPEGDAIPPGWIVDHEDQEVLAKPFPPEYNTIGLNDIIIWVDPLDGTTEFTTGLLEHVTILVGISVRGRPIAGVINQPFYKKDGVAVGRTIWGMKGVGYGGFQPKPAPADKIIVTVTRSRSDKQLESTLAKLKPDDILRVGGAGHKVLLVLEGKAHAYIVPGKGPKRWDTCACEAILESVGGLMTDIEGNYYDYKRDGSYMNKNGCIAILDKSMLDTFLNLFKQ